MSPYLLKEIVRHCVNEKDITSFLFMNSDIVTSNVADNRDKQALCVVASSVRKDSHDSMIELNVQ